MSQKEENTKVESSKKYFVQSTIFKIMLILVFYTLFYGIYLDGQIRNKMDGQIWELPAEVYSKIDSIALSDGLSQEKIKQILIDNGYRQTTSIVAPGDFKIENNNIVLLRRAFPFPENPELQRVLRLRFSDNKLNRIEDLGQIKVIDAFRLDPKLIAFLQSNSNEERLVLPLIQYPRFLIDALILTEDKRFFQHDGISPSSIFRALIANYQAGHTVQGGSTLTQQLVKNLFLTNKKSFIRKINEALMALLLDWRYDKLRILETYLNEVYLGQNGNYQVHGFALASQFYFGVPIQEATPDQIALLVGLVKGPSFYNPWKNPQEALERRNVIWKLLLENKKITQEDYQFRIARPLGIKERGSIYAQQPAFMQALNIDLTHILGKNNLSQLSGAKIFTSLDRKQQRAAELAVIEGVEQLENSNKKIKDLQSAIVVAEYRTGKVRAIVGDKFTQFSGFNRAIQAKRQIGSLVKPSIYAIALSEPQMFRLNTPIENQPITITIKGSPPWTPRNYDRRFSGTVMLMDALVRSLNIPTVNIGMKVGLKKVIDMQKAMGWDQVKIPVYPSTLLGAYSISPYDVTRSYQVIANSGVKLPLSTLESIIGYDGRLIYQRDMTQISQNILTAEATIQTLYAMQQVVERGTAHSLQTDFAHLHIAGKTGTTNNARDTWFVGIDGENVTTVWLGKDDNSDTHLTGASGALSIYKNYLHHALPQPFILPTSNNIQWVGINSYGGWQCDSSRQIPVWRDRNQRYCTSAGTVIESKPSVWDALSLSSEAMNKRADVAEEQSIPNEEIAPTD